MFGNKKGNKIKMIHFSKTKNIFLPDVTILLITGLIAINYLLFDINVSLANDLFRYGNDKATIIDEATIFRLGSRNYLAFSFSRTDAIIIFDHYNNFEMLDFFEGHNYAFSHDGSNIIVGTYGEYDADKSDIKKYKINKDENKIIFSRKSEYTPVKISISKTGKYFAIGSLEGGHIVLLNAENGNIIKEFSRRRKIGPFSYKSNAHSSGIINDLQFHNKRDDWLVSCASDAIRVWDIISGKIVSEVDENCWKVESDSKTNNIIVGGKYGLNLFDPVKGKIVRNLGFKDKVDWIDIDKNDGRIIFYSPEYKEIFTLNDVNSQPVSAYTFDTGRYGILTMAYDNQKNSVYAFHYSKTGLTSKVIKINSRLR